MILRKMALVLILATLLGALPQQPALMQQDGERFRYFEETGHYVRGVFLDFFESRGGLRIFGYPITEPFVDQGFLVQYFQNARMEWHPNNPDPYKVQLGLLGDELRYQQPFVPRPQFSSRRRVYFPETGHTVAYAFLDYFNANGGIDIFGYPISEMYFEDGTIVQYFQRLKMEWHPQDNVNPVQIGNLGELYVSVYRSRMPQEAFTRRSPIPTADTTPEPIQTPRVTALRAVVSLRYSVMGQQGDQTVSVLVTDNTGAALPEAQVDIRFISPSGATLGSRTGLRTDGRGFVRAEIPVTGGRTGEQVVVQADVRYSNLTTNAQNIFLLWW